MPHRLDFTVVGPAVNLTARLERMTRTLGRRVVASEAFAGTCGSGRLEPLGRHRVHNIAEPVAIWALPDHPPAEAGQDGPGARLPDEGLRPPHPSASISSSRNDPGTTVTGMRIWPTCLAIR